MWSRSLCVLSLIVFSTPIFAGRFGSSRTPTGGHSYPHSTGYSGTGTGTSTGGKHTYPHSTGYSGNGYPRQGNRPSTTTVHHHYHYSPPQQVRYGSGVHPVYHGQPPTYVYQYRDSGSRFNTLLAGLALYNLGRMTSGNHHSDYHRGYRSNPGETCKLGVRKDNGDYEESRVDCRIMTSFILDAETEKQSEQIAPAKSVTTVTNSSVISPENGTVYNNTVVTVTTVDALQDKGPPIQVTPKMQCYMIHVTYSSTNRKTVPCGLLQAYAESSLRRSGAGRLVPLKGIVFSTLVFFLNGYLFTDR